MKFVNIQPISYLKTNTSDVVKQVQETHDPVAITVNGKVQAIVQDTVSYQQTHDQLTMLRILAHSKKQIEDGKVSDHDDFFAQLEAETQRHLCERAGRAQSSAIPATAGRSEPHRR